MQSRGGLSLRDCLESGKVDAGAQRCAEELQRWLRLRLLSIFFAFLCNSAPLRQSGATKQAVSEGMAAIGAVALELPIQLTS